MNIFGKGGGPASFQHDATTTGEFVELPQECQTIRLANRDGANTIRIYWKLEDFNEDAALASSGVFRKYLDLVAGEVVELPANVGYIKQIGFWVRAEAGTPRLSVTITQQG